VINEQDVICNTRNHVPRIPGTGKQGYGSN
jgi:hypothetical protein